MHPDDTSDDADAYRTGGDPACWAALVCPNCGALPDPPVSISAGTRCARCGEPYPDD